jgi:hypothetical protein
VRDRATISITGVSSEASVELYDEAGRLVRELGAVSVDGAIMLDVSTMASGSYTVRVRTATGVSLLERVTVHR